MVWLAGPVYVIGMAAALAFAPYLLGYDSVSAFVGEHRHGASWVLAASLGCPLLIGIAFMLAIAPLRSRGVAIRVVGEALVFTGPFNWSIAKDRVRRIEVREGESALIVMDTEGQSRTVGVPFLDASAVELRDRILRALGHLDIA